jgi:hypothetical protein
MAQYSDDPRTSSPPPLPGGNPTECTRKEKKKRQRSRVLIVYVVHLSTYVTYIGVFLFHYSN